MGFIDSIKKSFYGRVAQKETIENLGVALSTVVTMQALANRSEYHNIHGIKAVAIYDELMARGGVELVNDVYDIAIKEGRTNVERVINGRPVVQNPAGYSILKQADGDTKLGRKPFNALSGGNFMSTITNLIGGAARSQKIADEFLLYMTPVQKKNAIRSFARRMAYQDSPASDALYDKIFSDNTRKAVSVAVPGLGGFTYMIAGAVASVPAVAIAGGVLTAGSVGMFALHSIKSVLKNQRENYLNDVLSGAKNPSPSVFFKKFPPGNMDGILSIMEAITPEQLASARQRYPDLPVAESEKADYVREQVDLHNMAVSGGKTHQMSPGMDSLYVG